MAEVALHGQALLDDVARAETKPGQVALWWLGQHSFILKGGETVVFIDPYLSVLTDDVAEGKVSDPYFRRSVLWLTGSRLAGTVLAQLLLVPAALWIVAVADWL